MKTEQKKELEEGVAAHFEDRVSFSTDVEPSLKKLTSMRPDLHALICALHQMGLSDMLVNTQKGREIQVE